MQHKYKDKNSFGYTIEPSNTTEPIRDSLKMPPNMAEKKPTQNKNSVNFSRTTQKTYKEDVQSYTQPVAKTKAEYDDFGHKKKEKIIKKESKSKVALSWVLSIAVAVGIAFLVRMFLFEIILVEGESMYPTLNTSQRVAVEKVSRYFSLPKRGDVVIVLYPNMKGTYVKRVMANPGETVEVKDSTVYIDGVPLKEDYINHEPYADMAAVVVPEDTIFVMGDNRAHSLDSRTDYIGPIPKQSIIGHGTAVIWPLNEVHAITKTSD